MKKYKDFIRENKIEEGFLSNIFKGIGSFIRGDKKKIEENVARMVEVGKDFIDKSDELNYNMFLSDFKKSSDPVVLSSIKQKSLMSKRAIEALKVAKDSEVNLLVKEIKGICDKNPSLLIYYHSQKSAADAEIAKYAYEKAKNFKDAEYTDQFYNQWQDLDNQAREIKKYTSSTQEDELIYIPDIFNLSEREFDLEISSLPKSDVMNLFNDAKAIQFALNNEISKISIILRNKKNIYWGTDPSSSQIPVERYEEALNKYKKDRITIDSKIAKIKKKLKIK